MKILGIESSCDDTCAAIVEDGHTVLSSVVASQVDIFASYGGVIPEIAARSHLEAIEPVIKKSLTDASLSWADIDAIAVTNTPGLLGSLLVGALTARTLAILHSKPLYPVHHLKSHIYANWLNTSGISPTFPAIGFVISGGHTQLLYMPSHNTFKIIGTTLDDAVGECFDKVAKILGLPYPGGPSISNLAKSGDREKYSFPVPKTKNPLDFSFSGLKTAVLRSVQSKCRVGYDYPSYALRDLLSEAEKADFAASFELSAVRILLGRLKSALSIYPETKSLIFGGGVSSNSLLRSEAKKSLGNNAKIFFPEPRYSADNAAMVASAAYYESISGIPPTDPYSVSISPRSPLS